MALTDQPLRLEELLATGAQDDCGALAVFAGTVRNHADGRPVLRLRYTAYEPVAQRLIAEIESETRAQFGVPYCRIEHRCGTLEIGDVALFCAVRAPHRAEAFAALRFAVDEVKHRVPIWKEEFYADGASAFVEGCCIRQDGEPDEGHGRCDHSHAPHAPVSA